MSDLDALNEQLERLRKQRSALLQRAEKTEGIRDGMKKPVEDGVHVVNATVNQLSDALYTCCRGLSRMAGLAAEIGERREKPEDPDLVQCKTHMTNEIKRCRKKAGVVMKQINDINNQL